MGLSDAESDFILLFILKIFMDVSFSLSMCAVVCACAPVLSPEDDIGGLISHGLPIPLRKIISLNLGLVFFSAGQDPPANWGHRCVWMPGFLDGTGT